MPRKPKHPCASPGCPNLTEGRYCEQHQREENKRYDRYDRNPAHKKRYNSAWKDIRDAYIHEHPVCERCFDEGKVVLADEVHHKLPLAEGGTNDWDNLISLCKSCHSRIHARRGDRWRKNRVYTY